MNNYTQKLSIKSWAEDDRPREKLILKGRSSLTDAELIAILIGSGSRSQSAVDLSKVILNAFKNNINEIGKASVTELKKFKGIGEAKAISIIAALELGRRRKEEGVIKRDKIRSSNDAYNALYPLLADKKIEEFWVVLLNQNNKIISREFISKGGVSGTVADVRVILKLAIDQLASGVILAHNHPSGAVNPSNADKLLTTKIKNGAELLDIKVLDHIIIGEDDYFSFADANILS
jgi:DNA repair protein RadC